MKFEDTYLTGLKIIKPKKFRDERGDFIKVYNTFFYESNHVDIKIEEIYFSVSKKNVIRGMHFQAPPFDHIKIVYVTSGEILDVVLDIRLKSPTYGQYFSIKLSDKKKEGLYIPSGFAHGFLSLTDNAIVTYMQSTVYSNEYDSGILFNSFNFNWKIKKPILSNRDLLFPRFIEFNSPFK